MFRSTYIPVQENNTDGVYHSTKYFDGDHLRRAVQLLQNPDEEVAGVKLSSGNIYFDDDNSLSWPVFEIFMAYNALHVAETTGFWFNPIRDVNNIVQLFLSIPFHEKCILVNALTTHSILLRNKAHIMTVRQLKSSECTYVHLQRLFMMLEGIDTGQAKVLSAVRVSTPEGDQYMVTNPFTYPYHDQIKSYGVDCIEEFRVLLSGTTRKTESFKISATGIVRHDSVDYPTIPREIAQMLVETYDQIVANKSNYMAIYDHNMEDHLYWSMNKRYLVRSDTLECVIVKNERIKSLLTIVADWGANDSSHLELIWRLACQL